MWRASEIFMELQFSDGLLAAGLDRQPLPQLVAPDPPVEHANIRGAEYYADAVKPAQEVG